MALHLRVIVPAFKEGANLATFHEVLSKELNVIKTLNWSLLFAIDKSLDDTEEVAQRIIENNANCSALIFANKAGHQNALLAGIKHSLHADVIVTMDADLQHPPSLIPSLLEKFYSGCDIVHTTRKSSEDVSLLRKTLGNLFYFIFSKLSSIDLAANSADFRLISNRVAKMVAEEFPENNIFLRGIFSWIGFKQSYVTFEASPRMEGSTKYTFSKSLKFALNGILSFSTAPLVAAAHVGIVIALIAIVCAMYFFIRYFYVMNLPDGWTTLITVFLLFTGVQLIFMGIIGAYVGRIYGELKKRPRYIIEKVVEHE